MRVKDRKRRKDNDRQQQGENEDRVVPLTRLEWSYISSPGFSHLTCPGFLEQAPEISLPGDESEA